MGRGKARRPYRQKNWTAQDYADVVQRLLKMAVSHIIDAGRTLAEAKEHLEHGEWLRMFRDHENHLERPLPFGARKAQMLMRIAEHPILSDANHGSHLPTSWRTLYELTRVPDPVLERALAKGLIHPAMERKHVPPMLVEMRSDERMSISTPDLAPEDLEQLRAEVLARPEFSERRRAISEKERELDRLERTASALRSELRALRARLAEEVQEAIENEASDRAFTISPQVAEILASVELPDESEAVSLETDQFICTSCEQKFAGAELVEVRECPHCGDERFDGTMAGQHCPNCNRPFTRLITEQGCPDCLGEDGDVVAADEAALETPA
jgi:Zn finger protein HypA/HybF involved in hydrogenase expression